VKLARLRSRPSPAENLRDPAAAADRVVARLAARAGTPRERLGTLWGTLACRRPGCGRPVPRGERQRGSERRFCSARCRRLSWKAERPAKELVAPSPAPTPAAAPIASPAPVAAPVPVVPVDVRPRRLELCERAPRLLGTA
jgi:hypothetical protein